jgi:16S rRNA (cytosine967-C5)-methyltransferase
VASASADRSAAARILLRVESGAFASRLLASSATPGVRARVLGVLRWQRALDLVLAPDLRRPLARLDPEVRAVLRLGLFEASQLEVPRAVATDAAVHLVRQLGKSSASGLVNAVLRRAAAGWSERLAAAGPDGRLSHPAWLFNRWQRRFGAATSERIMATNQVPARPWVWFLDGAEHTRLEAAGVALEPHPWCPEAWTAQDRAKPLMAAAENGAAYVQDPASQLVARVALELAPDGDRRLLDVCAAPGGKIALMMRHRQWSVAAAMDILPQRGRMVRDLVGRLGASCSVLIADACSPPVAERSWDLVVLDAPCSGTGTLRRHPDLRWRLTADSIRERAGLQRRLLAAVSDLVAAGGILLYATCSLEAEENERLLRETPPGLSLVDLGQVLPSGLPMVATAAGGVCILPGPDNDGFTIHALRRA